MLSICICKCDWQHILCYIQPLSTSKMRATPTHCAEKQVNINWAGKTQLENNWTMYETAQEEDLNEWQILNDGNVCFSNGDRLHPKVFAKNASFSSFRKTWNTQMIWCRSVMDSSSHQDELGDAQDAAKAVTTVTIENNLYFKLYV